MDDGLVGRLLRPPGEPTGGSWFSLTYRRSAAGAKAAAKRLTAGAVSYTALLGGALLVKDIVGRIAGEGLTETTLVAGRERVWGRTTPCVPGSAGV